MDVILAAIANKTALQSLAIWGQPAIAEKICDTFVAVLPTLSNLSTLNIDAVDGTVDRVLAAFADNRTVKDISILSTY